MAIIRFPRMNENSETGFGKKKKTSHVMLIFARRKIPRTNGNSLKIEVIKIYILNAGKTPQRSL